MLQLPGRRCLRASSASRHRRHRGPPPPPRSSSSSAVVAVAAPTCCRSAPRFTSQTRQSCCHQSSSCRSFPRTTRTKPAATDHQRSFLSQQQGRTTPASQGCSCHDLALRRPPMVHTAFSLGLGGSFTDSEAGVAEGVARVVLAWPCCKLSCWAPSCRASSSCRRIQWSSSTAFSDSEARSRPARASHVADEHESCKCVWELLGLVYRERIRSTILR